MQMTLIKKYLKDIIYLLIILILFIISIVSISKCSSNSSNNEVLKHNIECLTDTISYYKDKNGNLVASSTILINDIDLLKKTNEKLYNDMQAMDAKNAELILELKGYIDNDKKDTIYELDTVISNLHIIKEFNFKNNYRWLNGSILLDSTKLSLNIDKDIVWFDYILAEKDGKVYIKSDNPYVKYNEISGLVIKNKSKKHWNIGIQAGFGVQYSIFNKSINMGPYIGAGISYGFCF